MDKSWSNMFNHICKEDINTFVDSIYEDNINCYPNKEDVLNAFKYFKLKDTKVVILGQDCYINSINIDGKEIPQANGLAFSVNKEHKIPPSLKNIFKEMNETLDMFEIPKNGDLTYLAKQGVLLLNCALTVIKGSSNSHAKMWKPITDEIIKYISNNTNNIVFILWGNFAKSKKDLIDINKHYIIEGKHPSPLSARYNKKGTDLSFFGHNYFNNCNNYLYFKNKGKIVWNKN
jgi:uracil-DNA glycosylase